MAEQAKFTVLRAHWGPGSEAMGSAQCEGRYRFEAGQKRVMDAAEAALLVQRRVLEPDTGDITEDETSE